MQKVSTQPLVKPLLRGYFHQEAFFVSLGACLLLILKASTPESLKASLVYSFGLLFLFGVSAIYHRPHWEPKPRAMLRRLDHSAIFVVIAGSVTPVCLLSLPHSEGYGLLTIIWSVAVVGIFQSIIWIKAPKWFNSIFYVSVGLIIAPYLPGLKTSLGTTAVALIAAGGFFEAAGAVFYAMRAPNLKPGVFGYHELFHIFTIIGAIFHFAVIYRIIH